jgi:hypothetical protein
VGRARWEVGGDRKTCELARMGGWGGWRAAGRVLVLDASVLRCAERLWVHQAELLNVVPVA